MSKKQIKKIAIYGASGHGKVVAEIAKSNNYEVVAFIDDGKSKKIFNQYSITFEIFLQKYDKDIPIALGIGDNYIRKKIFKKIKNLNYNIITLIDKKAIISKSAIIGNGTVIMANTVVNVESKIGKCSILNTSSVIEHENIIGNFVHISPNSSLAGNVKIGNFTHIGIGSSIIQNIKIGKNNVIGAGAVVINNIKNNKIVVGIPAKIIN